MSSSPSGDQDAEISPQPVEVVVFGVMSQVMEEVEAVCIGVEERKMIEMNVMKSPILKNMLFLRRKYLLRPINVRRIPIKMQATRTNAASSIFFWSPNIFLCIFLKKDTE